MLGLWTRTFALFRRHFVLWVPCSVAAILMLAAGRLERIAFRWLFLFFLTQRSVLGGAAAFTGDIAEAQHRAIMVLTPIGLLRQFFEVCLFVMALIATKELVNMLLEGRRPAMIMAARPALNRYREVLLFSVKYMVLSEVFLLAFAALPTSRVMPERVQAIALSRPFVYTFGLVAQACLAWLLMPAALRLLRTPGRPTAATEERKLGTVFAVATSAAALGLQYSAGKAEAAYIVESQWEDWALALINTVVVNVPMIILFIALALLAINEPREEEPVAATAEVG